MPDQLTVFQSNFISIYVVIIITLNCMDICVLDLDQTRSRDKINSIFIIEIRSSIPLIIKSLA
jgi:hypothetical protein